MFTSTQKRKALQQLAKKRQQTRPDVLFGKHYYCAGEFDGSYDTDDHVSPWSKSAQNVDAAIMVVGQDWASEKRLRGPVNYEHAQLGYNPKLQTNINLQSLLRTHFQKNFSDVYATNAFPFIKPGGMQGSISPAHMELAGKEFLLPQIRIIQPQIAICLGLDVFNAVRKSCGHDELRPLDDAIKAPFDFCYDQSPPRFSISALIGGRQQHCTKIVAAAHTGTRGTNNRGRDQVEKDWASIRLLFNELSKSN